MQSISRINLTEEIIPAAVLDNVANDDGNAGYMSLFVDNDGKFYYHPLDFQNLVSLHEKQVTDTTTTQAIANGDYPVQENDNQKYQTISLLPSESETGERTYMLVVQTKEHSTINYEKEKKESTDDNACNIEYEQIEEDTEGTEVEKVSVQPKKIFTCTFCSYSTPRRYLLGRHLKKHSEDRPHKCEECGRPFKTISSLQNHINMHNGVKPYICTYCKSGFTTSGEMVRHVRYKHTHEKPHKCTECDYASVESSKLRRHLRCHTGERPYQCPHCTYACTDTFKLKRHLRTHTGEKPYKCDDCNMHFSQSNSLKAHRLIHLKQLLACERYPSKGGHSDMLVTCKCCERVIPDTCSCKSHLKTHVDEICCDCNLLPDDNENPFICDLCGQSYMQKQLLIDHINLNHDHKYVAEEPEPDKFHICPECESLLEKQDKFNHHMEMHNGDHNQQKALAPDLGQQNKVQIIDDIVMQGDISHETDNEQCGTNNCLSVNYQNPQETIAEDYEDEQYVVIQVIQLEDGSEQHTLLSSGLVHGTETIFIET